MRALSKSFSGPGGRPLPVLEDITLDVHEGEFVALLGRSGSGKSTLLRCIAGLMAPTEGDVLFRGKPLAGTNRETSMVFQTFALMPWLTVQQNVELGLEARGIAAQERNERALRASSTTDSSTPMTTSGRAVWLMLSVACGVKESVSACTWPRAGTPCCRGSARWR